MGDTGLYLVLTPTGRLTLTHAFLSDSSSVSHTFPCMSFLFLTLSQLTRFSSYLARLALGRLTATKIFMWVSTQLLLGDLLGGGSTVSLPAGTPVCSSQPERVQALTW